MAFTTLNLGLTLTIPTNGTRNWGTTMFNTTWTKISSHDHTGSGNGQQIVTAALAANAVTGAKFRLDNNEYLRGRNAANNADINILKVNTSDQIDFPATSNFPAASITNLILANILTPYTLPVASAQNASASTALDFAAGIHHTLTMSAAGADFAIASVSNAKTGAFYTLKLQQGSTPYNITAWPASFKFPQGQAPIITMTANALDILLIFFDGTNYFVTWDKGYQ